MAFTELFVVKMLDDINKLLDPVVDMVENHMDTLMALGIGSYLAFLFFL